MQVIELDRMGALGAPLRLAVFTLVERDRATAAAMVSSTEPTANPKELSRRAPLPAEARLSDVSPDRIHRVLRAQLGHREGGGGRR